MLILPIFSYSAISALKMFADSRYADIAKKWRYADIADADINICTPLIYNCLLGNQAIL